MNPSALYGSGAMLAIVDLAVTIAISRSAIYEPSQKRIQYLLIWLVPVVGAVVAWCVLRAQSEPFDAGKEISTGNPYIADNYPDRNEGNSSHDTGGHGGP